MEAKTNRYQSRILREMHHNNENPFNSPPSSTGSHGTVTLTSDVSFNPEGESTRRERMDDSIALPSLKAHLRKSSKGNTPFKVNTSAIGRNFPEWKGWNNDSPEHTEDMNDTDHHLTPGKENVAPHSSSTAASPTEVKSHQKQLKTGAPVRTLAQMQARVDDESIHSNRPSSKRGGNVTSLIQTLKEAQAKKDSTPKSSPKLANPRLSQLQSIQETPGTVNQTSRSFFLPNLVHIDDFVSGALKLSSTGNGIPVFVKNGQVRDHHSKTTPDDHADVDAIEVPEDEQRIFVSLDNIRDEIQALQEHDDHVSRQAEQLQNEVYELQLQMAKLKSRKDSGMGSIDSNSESSLVENLNSQKAELKRENDLLKGELDKARRKISINEIHTDSYVLERDEALKNATTLQEKIERLQSELAAARSDLKSGKRGANLDMTTFELENQSLRDDIVSIKKQFKSLLQENHSLRDDNALASEQITGFQVEIRRLQRTLDSLQGEHELLQKEYEIVVEEKRAIKQDNLNLERQNDKFYNENKTLQQKIGLLERRVRDLQTDNERLHELLDAANAETGTMTTDMKDVKNRLDKRNRELSNENVQLQQQLIELEAGFTERRVAFEQEKQRLTMSNDRLNDQIDQISKHFEQIVRESKEEAAKYEERQSSLTQQLQDLKSGGTPTKTKPLKVTRIVEPTEAKGKSAMAELSARSTSQLDTQMQDDLTRRIDLTQGSDFSGNSFPASEVSKMREALRKARAEKERDQEEGDLDDEPALTEDMSLSLPFIPQARRDDGASMRSRIPSKGQPEGSKSQLSGILKNALPPRQMPEPELSGRFSVKSAASGMSIPSPLTKTDPSHGRRHSDSVRFDLDVDANETSALFMDDITLQSRKRVAQQEKAAAEKAASKKGKAKAVPTLSKDAKRVLDSLCHDHDCRNCIVCTRINSHRHEGDTTTRSLGGKKTVRVDKPTPVTDHMPNPTTAAAYEYEDPPTLRPSRQPGVALAVVIKNIEDEIAHIAEKLAGKNAAYAGLDAAYDQRGQRLLSAGIGQLMRVLDAKRHMLYMLHDVLEGQKASGQLMTDDDVDVTIESIMAKDVTWDGLVD